MREFLRYFQEHQVVEAEEPPISLVPLFDTPTAIVRV
jgi:hypothetical protein